MNILKINPKDCFIRLGKLISAAFLLLSIFLEPSLALAHVLKTDGSIGAILHIDPNDDPIAGEQSGLFFDIKDKQGLFQPQDCVCTVSVLQNGQQIFSQSLFAVNPNPSLTNASVFFTFPQIGVYQLKVTGQPNSGSNFQPFTLIYDIRVARSAPAISPSPSQNILAFLNDSWLSQHLIHLAGGVIALLFLIFALIRQSVKTKTDPPNLNRY